MPLAQLEFEGGLLVLFLSTTSLLSILGLFFWYRGFRPAAPGDSVIPLSPGTPTIGFVDLALGTFIWMGGQVIAGAVLTTFYGPVPNLESASPEVFRAFMFASGISQIAAVLLTACYFQIRYRHWGARRAPDIPATSHLKTAIIGFVMILPIIMTLQWVLSLLVPYEHPTLEALLENGSPLTMAACWFAAVIAAPISEEFVFRGLLQNWLQRLNENSLNRNEVLLGGESVPVATLMDGSTNATNLKSPENKTGNDNPYVAPASSPAAEYRENSAPPIWPMFVTSVLFGLAHMGQGLAPIPLFFFSLMLGFLYRQTQSLIPCILVHFMLNAYSMFWFSLGSVFVE